MANGFPTVVPAGFAGNIFDFNKAKVDRSGAVRHYQGTVSVPSGTASGSKIGIIPIRTNFRLVVDASSLWFDSLDSSNTATYSAGITYQTGSSQTEAPATYIAAGGTAIQAGGHVTMNAVKAGETYVALDDGWVTVTTAAAATNTLGNIAFSLAGTYDHGGLS